MLIVCQKPGWACLTSSRRWRQMAIQLCGGWTTVGTSFEGIQAALDANDRTILAFFDLNISHESRNRANSFRQGNKLSIMFLWVRGAYTFAALQYVWLQVRGIRDNGVSKDLINSFIWKIRAFISKTGVESSFCFYRYTNFRGNSSVSYFLHRTIEKQDKLIGPVYFLTQLL